MFGRHDDSDLVRKVAGGDENAVAELFGAHRDFVFRVAYGTCGCREDSVEIVQEVFLALIQGAATLDLDRAGLTTWLYRVARNKAIDVLRRRPMPLYPDRTGEVDPLPAPDSALLRTQRNALLRDAVTRLPARPREVFVLRIGLGLSVAETARLTETEPGAVRSALHTAKSQLRRAIERAEKPPGETHARRHAARRR